MVIAGAVAQVVAEGVDIEKPPPETVLVEFRGPGNAMNATVSWSAPEGTRTYTGELPLMNVNGTHGVSYEMP